MGLLHDLFFGTSPKTDATRKTEQDFKMEEQKRYVDEPDWKGYSWGQAVTKTQNEPTAAEDPYRDASGSKIRPEVEIVRVKSDLSNDLDHVDVWVTVKNASEFEVEVSKVSFLGRFMNVQRFLKPGESHEFRLYSGDTPENESYHDSDVQYKIVENGDYFQARHYVKYQYEQHDGKHYYVPEEFQFHGMVKDI